MAEDCQKNEANDGGASDIIDFSCFRSCISYLFLELLAFNEIRYSRLLSEALPLMALISSIREPTFM